MPDGVAAVAAAALDTDADEPIGETEVVTSFARYFTVRSSPTAPALPLADRSPPSPLPRKPLPELVLEYLPERLVAGEGVHDLQLLGEFWTESPSSRRYATTTASVSSSAPGGCSTTAQTRSPRSASGRPITATSPTAGCWCSRSSISFAMFSPLRMMTSSGAR